MKNQDDFDMKKTQNLSNNKNHAGFEIHCWG
jgi:hypothetical protein